MSSSPAIAPAGIMSIMAELAPNSFGMALDVSMTVGFDETGERIDFVLANAGKESDPDAAPEFMAVLHEHRNVVAARLHEARQLALLGGEDVPVTLDDLSTRPVWAAFKLTAGPVLAGIEEADRG
jgi:hypothetical protein